MDNGKECCKSLAGCSSTGKHVTTCQNCKGKVSFIPFPKDQGAGFMVSKEDGTTFGSFGPDYFDCPYCGNPIKVIFESPK